MDHDCDQKDKIDQILHNQEQSARDMKDAIDKLTAIIMADVERRVAVDQLKKETGLLFEKARRTEDRVEDIERRNARCDGAGIFENFPKMWEWYQSVKQPSIDFQKVWRWYLGELGWRRFIPAVLTVLCAIIVIWDKIK